MRDVEGMVVICGSAFLEPVQGSVHMARRAFGRRQGGAATGGRSSGAEHPN